MEDIQNLLTAMLPFVEDLLKKYGEFFPLAAASSSDGKIDSIGAWDGNERPQSMDVINDLKIGLQKGVQKERYDAIAIFYDVTVTDHYTDTKTDAIAVWAESKTEPTGFTFYYPYPYYINSERQLIFSKSWGAKRQKELFKMPLF